MRGYRDPSDMLYDIDNEINELRRRKESLINQAEKSMEPKDERLVALALEAGEMHGRCELLTRDKKELEEKIKEQREEISRTDDRDEWRERAYAAEAKLAKRKKRK